MPIMSRNGSILVRGTGGVLATDCGVTCRITLNLEDQRCSATPRDVGLVVTGKIMYQIDTGPACSSATNVLKLFADESGPITVQFAWRSGACVQRIKPKVDGAFRTWDDGSELLVYGETKQVTLSKGQRLQLYMTNLYGCVDGDHDDSGGRATWSIQGCREVCSPCISEPQNAVSIARTGSCGEFYMCGLVDMMPGSLRFCESWAQSTWAGNCCWVWAESIDISQWTAPDWVFNYVLIMRYARNGAYVEFQNNHTDNSRPPGFSAEIYCGSDFDNDDPCYWMVGADPLFVSTAASTNTIQCGPDGKLHGQLQLFGRDSGWGGGDATGYTATITLP